MNLGEDYINLFTCGDQLLWGAAEPLKCMLELLADYYRILLDLGGYGLFLLFSGI